MENMQDIPGFVTTLNNMGWMTTELDPYSQAFIDLSRNAKQPALELGAAYGQVSRLALAAGAEVVSNDLDPRHLEYLEQHVNADERQRLTCVSGAFPTDLAFPKQYFAAILACRILHFLSGEQLDHGLDLIYQWLIPQGQVFVTCETPYLINWQTFIPEFLARKARHEAWPGIVEAARYETGGYKAGIPDYIHLFDTDTLSALFIRHGFTVVQCGYINRKNWPDNLRLDGRESVGIIAAKG